MTPPRRPKTDTYATLAYPVLRVAIINFDPGDSMDLSPKTPMLDLHNDTAYEE